MVRFTERLRSRGIQKREIWRFSADREKAAGIIKEKLEGKQSYYMPEKEAAEILGGYGFPLLESRIVRDSSEIDAVKDCILRLSQMVSDHPAIKELDINPLIVYPEGRGCVVADSRILLSLEES